MFSFIIIILSPNPREALEFTIFWEYLNEHRVPTLYLLVYLGSIQHLQSLKYFCFTLFVHELLHRIYIYIFLIVLSPRQQGGL